MRGVVLARGGKGHESSARSRNSHQSRIENWRAKNEQRSQPPSKQRPVNKPQLKTQRRHQKAQKNCAAITHKNFGGFEIPTEKSRGCAQHSPCQCGNQSLAIE